MEVEEGKAFLSFEEVMLANGSGSTMEKKNTLVFCWIVRTRTEAKLDVDCLGR